MKVTSSPRRFLPLAVLASLLLVFATAEAQIGRPGPGGMRPPGMPRGPGMGGGPIGPPQNVWSCGKCGNELGRGTFRPALMTCSKCGLVYRNGFARDTNPNAGIGGAPNPNPPANPFVPPATGNPPPNPNPNPFVPPATGNNPPVLAPPPAATSTAPTTSGISGPMIAVGIVVVILGLAMVGGVIALIVYSQKSASAGASRKRRRPRNDYDDRDEEYAGGRRSRERYRSRD